MYIFSILFYFHLVCTGTVQSTPILSSHADEVMMHGIWNFLFLCQGSQKLF
jgi:hypothetical protein